MEMKPKRDLIRVVKSPDGKVSLDASGKAPGRGAYLCRNAACFKAAQKAKRFGKVFKAPPDPTLFAALEAILAPPDDP
jgi:predicted RNA-binding protein YlxR (DUF448 family)